MSDWDRAIKTAYEAGRDWKPAPQLVHPEAKRWLDAHPGSTYDNYLSEMYRAASEAEK